MTGKMAIIRNSTRAHFRRPGFRRAGLRRIGMLFALAGGLALAGCEGAVPPVDDPYTPNPGQSNKGYDQPTGSIFGGSDEGGIDVFGIFGGGKGGGGGAGRATEVLVERNVEVTDSKPQ